MNDNPAKIALGKVNSGDSGDDLLKTLDDYEGDGLHPKSTDITMETKADGNIRQAISICTPLFTAAIEDSFIDPDDLTDAMESMLSALKSILAKAELNLDNTMSSNERASPELVKLCVQIISKLSLIHI